MPLVNCKVDLELTWNKDCVISSADAAADNVVSFEITDTKLYVPIVTLSTKDNTNLTKQLNEGFKRTVYWNRYKVDKENITANEMKALTDYLCLLLLLVIIIQHKTATENITCLE